jgi:hypothetical protein
MTFNLFRPQSEPVSGNKATNNTAEIQVNIYLSPNGNIFLSGYFDIGVGNSAIFL